VKILLFDFKNFSKHRHLYRNVPKNIFSIHTEKKILPGKCLFIAISLYLFITILLAKIARLTKASKRAPFLVADGAVTKTTTSF
jgi:hypothetical protein